MMFKHLATLLFLLMGISGNTLAQNNDPLAQLFSDEAEFLPVDEAFQFDFDQQGSELTLSWQIAEGYYLYKKQFKTVVKNAQLAEPQYPEAEQIEDEYFGVSDIFHDSVAIHYPIIESAQDGVVKIRYQGCAHAGLCYPPTTKVLYLNAVANTTALATGAAGKTDTQQVADNTAKPILSQQFELANLLSSEQSLLWSLVLFLLLGIGLAFTPCVFPMYPILSAIVIGQGKSISTMRALSLSFFYVQGMAITYSLLGLVVASAGVQFQASLQHPAILVSLIVVFVLLAVVMFGAYELQLPSRWQEKLNNLSNQQKSGSYLGVMLMGAISGLVASPCTTAPLTGILLYIAQSGDLLLGFSALYALSLGMGIPLILFAVTGGKLLPRAGNWMNIVKVSFGFMMLAVALLFVERMLTNLWTELVWSLLGLSTFSYYLVMNQSSTLSFWKGVRTLLIFIGLFASALYGYQQLSPGQAGSQQQDQAVATTHQNFMLIKDIDDFNNKLAAANAQGKSVMLDLYADWCIACKEFAKYTFPDPAVAKALQNTVLMQIDLTDNTEQNLQFQEHFFILGLPTILLFDQKGQELSSARVTGFMKADAFASHLESVLK